MPTTEIIIPPVKKDSQSIHGFQEKWPLFLQTFRDCPEILTGIRGFVVSENGKPSAEFTPVILFDWLDFPSYERFFASHEFEVFHGRIKPLLTGPPRPLVLETAKPLADLFPCKEIIEILQVSIPDESLASGRLAWHNYLAASDRIHQQPSISGASLNMDHTVFAAITTYETLDTYHAALSKIEAESELATFSQSSDVTRLVLKMEVRPLEI